MSDRFVRETHDFETIHYSDEDPYYNMLCNIVMLSIKDFKLLKYHGIIKPDDMEVMSKEWPTYVSKNGTTKPCMFDFFYSHKSQVEELLQWFRGKEPSPKSLKGCIEQINELVGETVFDYNAVMANLQE